MKRTAVLLPAVALAIAMGLSGCDIGGSAAPAADVEQLAPGAEVTGSIIFWHGYGEDGAEVKTLTDVVIPAFEKLHPGVTVTPVQIPPGDMHQKLVTAAAAGSLPDIIRADIVTVPELAKLGTLVPLSQAMPDFQGFADTMYPGPLETNRYGDDYWGLPLDTNTKVVIYSQQGLEADGLDAIPATLDELKDAAENSKDGTYAFAEGGAGGWNLLPYIWSNGGDITDPNYTTADGYLNGPKSVAAIQMLVDLYNDGKLPGIILGGTGTGTWDGVPSGEYVSMVDGPWAMPVLQGAHPEVDFKTAPMFSGDGGSIGVVGGEDLVLTSQSENKPLAAEFLRYMLSEDAQVAMGEVGQLSAQSTLADKMSGLQPYYADFLTQLETAKPRPVTPQWAKIDDIFAKQIQLAFQGTISVQDALDEAVSQIDPLLAQG